MGALAPFEAIDSEALEPVGALSSVVPFAPERRSSLATDFLSIPSARAIWRWLIPEAKSCVIPCVLSIERLFDIGDSSKKVAKYLLYNEFKKNNILEDRLIFEEASTRDKLLLSYNNIDIALDTFPYTGGTTSLETAWMCVPLLTIKGDSFISRCGASVNSNLNQDHWTANNINHYIQLAKEYSSDYKKLDINRSYLRNNSRKTAIFNSKLFSKNFANALKKIWLDYVNTNNNT